jgi:hypothetical protein
MPPQRDFRTTPAHSAARDKPFTSQSNDIRERATAAYFRRPAHADGTSIQNKSGGRKI